MSVFDLKPELQAKVGKRTRAMLLASLVASAMVGCGNNDAPSASTPQQPSISAIATLCAGDEFLSSNLKIKSQITDTSNGQVVDVELYVDSKGNGQGLMKFGDTFCDVVVCNDILYLKVDDSVYISLNDITGRLVFSATPVAGSRVLEDLGFSMSGGLPIEYSARQGSLILKTKYAQSTQYFKQASIVSDTVLGTQDALKYIVDYHAGVSGDLSSATDTASSDTPVVENFYIKSKYGITIDGQVYSVGDTCNSRTYFNGLTPEGLLTTSEYKEDDRVDFLHTSYISATGRSVVVTTSNYVQALQSNAEFSFLGIPRGTSEKELRKILGYKLSSKDEVSWQPVDEAFTVTELKSNTYYCKVGNLNVELRMEKGVLSEIYIEQVLDFKGG